MTISSWLNFGRPASREGGLRRGEIFWLRFTTASAQCLRRLWALFFRLRCIYQSVHKAHCSFVQLALFKFSS